MTREELLEALRQIAPEKGPNCCIGCGYEHNCALHGCAIIKEAIQALRREAMTPQAAIDILRSANLAGVLRAAADMGIEALEREMGGAHEAD